MAGNASEQADAKNPKDRGLRRAPRRRGWTAWGATWLSMMASSLVAVLILANLSSRSARNALEVALVDHLTAQSGLVALSLEGFPVGLLSGFGGERTVANLREKLRRQAQAAHLHDLAVLGPELKILMDPDAETWISERAERDLIARAARGETTSGALYRDSRGDLYLTTYAPFPKQPGWVIALEGSGASLGAINALERLQFRVGAAVVALVGLLGALLARLVVQPIRRLDHELSRVRPGDPPEALEVRGSREVRDVSRAARALLEAIRVRDRELREAHLRELEQISRMAAEVAHEVRNPLNAMGLSVGRLNRLNDPERRSKVLRRLQDQIEQMEAIVQRWVHLAKPLAPKIESFDFAQSASRVASEIEELGATVVLEGRRPYELESDRTMVLEVVRNLCLNAVQAGADLVTIRFTKDGALLRVVLEDNGGGISEDEAAHIFEWFHTTRTNGSGLGLPTSRRMIQALGGSLELIDLEPARFLLLLPTEAS